jgi:hypothetical protein
MMGDLFARVRPVVGGVLEGCSVAVVGSSAAGLVVEYLVACGVRRWLVMAGNEWMGALAARVVDRFGRALELRVTRVASVDEVAASDLVLLVDAEGIAWQLPGTAARLAICTATGSQPSQATLALPGETLDLPERLGEPLVGGWDWPTAAPLMALWARALLLQGTPFRMATWEEAWTRGMRAYGVSTAHDPTVAVWQAQSVTVGQVESKAPVYHTPSVRQGTLLVAGLGSLGSVAAQQLAPQVTRLVLVDPDRVETVNLVRQAYSQHQRGQPKATALAQALEAAHPGLTCEPLVASLYDEREIAALVRSYGVTAALVATGTHADFAIARGLRAEGIPHVVGRCYARGRFWEEIVVDGAVGPSYEQVRRAAAAGPAAAPTPEEIASYGAVGELAAEPATAMETGWAALWLARLMAQMMAPAGLREGWLLARLAAGATCFIGGVEVEQGKQGAAYGITVPGQVHVWSGAEIGGEWYVS